MANNFRKLESETDDEYIFRISYENHATSSWVEIKKIINEEIGKNFNECTYRKRYQNFANALPYYTALKGDTNIFSSDLLQLELAKQDIYKEKCKNRTILNETNRLLRKQSLIEMILASIKEYNGKLPKIPDYESPKPILKGNEANLSLADWHLGDYFINCYNSYDIEEAKKRILSLQNKVIDYCTANRVTELHVLNLGDLINGNIHVTARIMNQENLIEQIKIASELVCQVMINLSRYLPNVKYHSVTDNHSRATVNFKENIEEENFNRLIDFFIEERLKDSNVEMCLDNLDPSIGYFKLKNGKNVFYVHGHLDKQNKVVENMMFLTGLKPDYVFMAHFHSAFMKNVQGCIEYITGSLMGTNTYAINKRLLGRPSQLLVIFDGLNEINININFA